MKQLEETKAAMVLLEGSEGGGGGGGGVGWGGYSPSL